jgi:hypothetical protein
MSENYAEQWTQRMATAETLSEEILHLLAF